MSIRGLEVRTFEGERAGLYGIQAALKAPLASGARVLVVSSGAAIAGNPPSGGYAGAKRMLWLMARYANSLSTERGLGTQFQVLVPQQIVGETALGHRPPAPGLDAGACRSRRSWPSGMVRRSRLPSMQIG